jgi:hypothetical protein
MAAFLDADVVGVDVEPPDQALPNRTFRQGSITALPFSDASFTHVACIDVLQDLAPGDRQRGVSELVRVAKEVVVIAAPNGDVARQADAAFLRALQAHGAPVPDWVTTSLAHPYPTVDAVLAAVREADPHATTSVTYAEPVRGSRLVRAAAARSRMLYAAANLALGLLLPAMRAPDESRSYRFLVVVHPRSL